MSLPADRTMPVTVARYHDLRHVWLVTLPGGVELPARDTAEAELLRDRHAPGSSLAFDRPAFRGERVEPDPPRRTALSAERTT